MNYFLLFFLTLFIASCGNRKPTIIPNDIKFQQIPDQLTLLLKKGSHAATVTTNKDLTPIQKGTFKKYINLIKADYSLQKKFKEILENPERRSKMTIPGMTQKEHAILLSIFKTNETSTYEGVVDIYHDENSITFKGTGKLSILDSLEIIPKDTTALFRERSLNYSAPDSFFHSNEFIPSDETLDYIYPFDSSTGISRVFPMFNEYLIVVSRLRKSGKTYIFLSINDPDDIERPLEQFYSIILEN